MYFSGFNSDMYLKRRQFIYVKTAVQAMTLFAQSET